jgi:glycosyltransferase involved in cell wall biosynthesis
MERRLGHHGLIERTTFIEAIPADSSEVDERLEGLGATATVPSKRVEAAVLASHLKAIRRFVEHGRASADGVIICEDDVLLHNDWNDRVPAIFANMPGDLTLCLLSFLTTSWDSARWAGRNPECHNLSTFDGATTWGSQMYWISRRYAQTVLERWDCPFKHHPPEFMAEVIVKWSSGLMCYPPLAIEDVIDSEVRPAEEITEFHLPLVRSWGYDNFSACEEGDESSPLAAQASPRTITVGLAVIARDEEHSLPALLATCNGAFDQVVLVDTGSKDATVQRFTEWAQTQPSTRCEVEHFAWIDDFSAARQRADDLLDTEWKVWADCDDEILGATHLRELAAAAPPDVAGFRFGYDYARDAGGSSTCYTKRERMVRSGHGRWVGRVHEVQTIEGRLEDVAPEVAEWIHHRERKASTGGGRPTGRDIQLLTEALEEDPNDPRTVFYLAQSNRDAGHRTRAIELYLRRAEMGGWSEEVFYSLYQAGVLRAQDGNQMEGMRLLLQAWELRPSRVEPLYELAWRMRAGGDHRSAYLFARQGLDRPEPDDSLFVERWIYRWGLLFECSISAYWVGEVVEAEQACLRLLALADLPESNRKQTQMNLGMIRQSPAAESVHPAPRAQSLIRTAQIGEIRLDVNAGRTNLAPRPLADLATSLVLAELRLELPERWNAFDALISLDGDDYSVEVSVTTPGDPQKLVVRLNARLEVDVVEVLGDGTHLGTHEDGNLQVPAGFVSSTPAVTLPLGDLCVLEQHKSDLAGLVFALLDSTCRVIAASPPFKMVSESSEERCGGLVVRDDEIILSFGIDKKAIGLAVLDTEEVLGLLEPCQ